MMNKDDTEENYVSLIFLTAITLIIDDLGTELNNAFLTSTAISLHQRTAAGKRIHHYFNEICPWMELQNGIQVNEYFPD